MKRLCLVTLFKNAWMEQAGLPAFRNNSLFPEESALLVNFCTDLPRGQDAGTGSVPQGALWTLGVDFWGLDALLQGVLQGAGSTLNLVYTLQHRYTAGCRCFAGCTLAFRWDGGALGSNDSKDRVKGKEHQLASAIIHPTLIIALTIQ